MLGTSGGEVVWSNGELFVVPTGKDSVATMVVPKSMLNELLLPTAKAVGLAVKSGNSLLLISISLVTL